MVAIAAALWLTVGLPTMVSAHAEPERANPPINGVVPAAPAVVEIWFSEEVKPEGSTILVIGPGGIQVDLGDSKVDLMDPDRKHMTVSLRSGLGSGSYTVQWHSVSGTDGDEAQGGFLFTVASGSPVASPVASPAALATVAPTVASTSVAAPVATVTPGITPTATSTAEEEDNFDGQAFGLSVGAGLVIAVLIFVFWRVVRPKNPKFRG